MSTLIGTQTKRVHLQNLLTNENDKENLKILTLTIILNKNKGRSTKAIEQLTLPAWPTEIFNKHPTKFIHCFIFPF